MIATSTISRKRINWPCPKCKRRCRVDDTRPTPDGVRRIRRCNCGHEVTTIEIDAQRLVPQEAMK